MLKIAFCDDDLEILKELGILLDKYKTERDEDLTCTVFQSPLELLAAIEKGFSFDILFLDILMPGENGIETAKEIRQYDNNMKIIFLTSSPEFAVQSYTVGAYFYQLKPVWEESFFRLMDSVRSKEGITRIDLEKLEYCEVIGRTLFFHLGNGKVFESVGSLDDLFLQLKPYGNFLRPHRSFLVNMDYIQNISYRAIKLISLAEIPIPHGKCSEIKNKYLEYAFNRKQVFLS